MCRSGREALFGRDGATQVGAESVNRGLAHRRVAQGEAVELVQHRGGSPTVGRGQGADVVVEGLAARHPSLTGAGAQRRPRAADRNCSHGG
jgi:hypothetical protein